MDKLIKIANERFKGQTQIMYSTPSCYLKALHDEAVAWVLFDLFSFEMIDNFVLLRIAYNYLLNIDTIFT